MDAFSLFSCPVAVFHEVGAPSLRESLASMLVDASSRTPSWSVSNHGGAWHSAPDLADRPEAQPLVAEILPRVRAVFDAAAAATGADTRALRLGFSVQMWAMVSRDGGYATVHDHAHAHWSLAYYPDSGDADLARHPDSGRIAFLDPRRVPSSIAGVELYPSTFSIQPRSGTLIVFPGWLQHFVHPYRGQRPRVVISANLRLEREGAPPFSD